VSKHAEARETWIDIRHADGMLRIGVTDNGHGGGRPCPRQAALRGIERRLASFDGILAISSPSGGPTAVTMEIPCELSFAEDLFLLRDGLTRMLQAHGLEITAAVDNGADLLAAVAQGPAGTVAHRGRPGLPPTFHRRGESGAALARAGGRLPGLPVLVLSQYVEQLVRPRAAGQRAAGASATCSRNRVFDSAPVRGRRPAGSRAGGHGHGPRR